MRDVVILLVHLIVTVVRLARPGGLRSVIAESVLVKHQLLILNRGRVVRNPHGKGIPGVTGVACRNLQGSIRHMKDSFVELRFFPL
ncbi:MAG TPA: hypothetical protein VNO32_23170 [Candidatus Acidoferrum sp.]|nr:hypothetical protein [Candidatus Acidoferrum sp.]